MKENLFLNPEFDGIAEPAPLAGVDWWCVEGEVIARSRSSVTSALDPIGDVGIRLHLKRYHYSLKQVFRGALRNTFLSPSRVAKEFEMLSEVRKMTGNNYVPRPVAFGERRVAGFLREAFLATETVTNASPLADIGDLPSDLPRRLGAFLGEFHRAGFTHGRLYARNLLVAGDGFRLVDLDRTMRRDGPASDPLAARDLACLFVSTPAFSARNRVRTIGAWLGADRDRGRIARMLEHVESAWDAAERGLARRDGPPHV